MDASGMVRQQQSMENVNERGINERSLKVGSRFGFLARAPRRADLHGSIWAQTMLWDLAAAASRFGSMNEGSGLQYLDNSSHARLSQRWTAVAIGKLNRTHHRFSPGIFGA